MTELRFTNSNDPAYRDLFRQAMARRGVHPSQYDLDRLAGDMWRLVAPGDRVVSAEYMISHLPDGVDLHGALPAYRVGASRHVPGLPSPAEIEGSDYQPFGMQSVVPGLTHGAFCAVVEGLRAHVERLTADNARAYRLTDLAIDLLDHSGASIPLDDPRGYARRVAGRLGLEELTELVTRYVVGTSYRWEGEPIPVVPETTAAGGSLSLAGNAF
ncbi:hypothetical protein [Corynebacterium resistens]|nr:hypothetical protein [Corynebacterium resistens]